MKQLTFTKAWITNGDASFRFDLKDLGMFNGEDLFTWRERPTVQTNSLDLAPYKDKFKQGYYYTFHIDAQGESGDQLSNTIWRSRGFDFRIE